jgi:hypothetical protein
MVGIGGGAPSSKNDIRLGDIVVSSPQNGNSGILQYDFGKAIQGQPFQATGILNLPPSALRAAVSGLKSQYEVKGHQLEQNVNRVLERNPSCKRSTSDRNRVATGCTKANSSTLWKTKLAAR